MDFTKLASSWSILKSGTLWSENSKCKGYAVSNPIESASLDNYVQAICAGQSPAAPNPTTATGKGLLGIIQAGLTVAIITHVLSISFSGVLTVGHVITFNVSST